MCSVAAEAFDRLDGAVYGAFASRTSLGAFDFPADGGGDGAPGCYEVVSQATLRTTRPSSGKPRHRSPCLRQYAAVHLGISEIGSLTGHAP